MKKLLRVLVVAALLVAIAIPCLAEECQHDWQFVKHLDPATCESVGHDEYKCSKCKETESVEVPKLGHKLSEIVTPVQGKEPTCNKDGEGTRKCTRQGCTYEEPAVIPKTNKHEARDVMGNEGTEKGKKPNCSEDGYEATKICKHCGIVMDTKPLPKTPGTNHVIEKITVRPTCSTKGYSYDKCKLCGWEGPHYEETDKLNHVAEDYDSVMTPATCTQPQKLAKKCKLCGEFMKETVHDDPTAPKLNHQWGDEIVDEAPTCTKPGKAHKFCNREGCKYNTKAYEYTLKATGHDTVTVTTPATCTEDGSIITTCKKCGEVIAKVEIPKLNHDYQWKVTKEANKCQAGEMVLVCKTCGDVKETRVIPATEEHKFSAEAKVVKAPTCTEEGLKDKVCTVCGTAEGKGEKIPALGHKAGEFVQTKAPTCTEKGEEVSKCTVCNAVVDTREVAAKGHTAGEWITVRQPSASQNGKMIQKCTVCGAQIGKKYIRANGSADTAAKTVAYVAGAEVANYAKIDLTVDATTELDLVSANGTKVGKLVVEVKEGKVTVKYELSAVPADAFLTFVTEAPAKDIHAQKEFEFEKAISVADELAGAAAAYIYVEIEY